MSGFAQVAELSDDDIKNGKTKTIRDGVTTQIMVTSTEGIFLVSFALLLGASNTTIGIIAAIPFLSQLGQVLGIYFLERIRVRKKIVVYSVFLSRIFLVFIAFIPLLSAPNLGIVLLIVFLILRNVTGSVAGVSWNAWMRDLIPATELGSFFANRMRIATIVGTGLLIVFSIFVDFWAAQFPDDQILGYSLLFGVGFLAGLTGLYFLYTTPEPIMPKVSNLSLREIFKMPFRDGNFRPLLVFLFIWNFAINMAAPFFTVYMITQLNLPIFQITMFLVLSQVCNILFLRLWGGFSDRFSYKTTLLVAAPIFILMFPLWTLTTNPGIYVLTYPLLIVIHIFLGITISGITLAVGTIAMKVSPKETASSYLATAGIINSVAAGIGTIFGGIIADYFADKSLEISLNWVSDQNRVEIPAVNLEQWDFVFLLAFLVGLIAIERLTLVKETGAISRKEGLTQFLNEVRTETRRFSTVAGLTRLAQTSIVIRRRERKRAKAKRKEQLDTDNGDERINNENDTVMNDE